MYLVIGATGRTGAAALDFLISRGVRARALVRDVSKIGIRGLTDTAEVVEGSVHHAGDLDKAMRDVACVYLSMGNFPGQEAVELKIIEAAAAAGVRKIVKLSAPTAGPSSPIAIARMHGRIEAAIMASRMAHVFLRPCAFFQNLANQLGPLAHLYTLFASTGSAPLNMVDARDVGEVAARTMLEETWNGASLELTGDEALSYAEVAKRLSTLSGETYGYVDRTPDVYRAELLQQGLPEWTAEHVVEIQAQTRRQTETPNSIVRDILGCPARNLNAYLPELLEMIAQTRSAMHGSAKARPDSDTPFRLN